MIAIAANDSADCAANRCVNSPPEITADFVTAGEAIFTVQNPAGEHYTYQVSRCESEQYGETFFVRVLTGPDNTSDYTYLGVLDRRTGDVRLTGKSRLTEDARPVKVIRWAMRKVWAASRGNDGAASLPEGYRIRHDGRCGRCGKTLTHPRSLTTGLGPECEREIRRAAKATAHENP